MRPAGDRKTGGPDLHTNGTRPRAPEYQHFYRQIPCQPALVQWPGAGGILALCREWERPWSYIRVGNNSSYIRYL